MNAAKCMARKMDGDFWELDYEEALKTLDCIRMARRWWHSIVW